LVWESTNFEEKKGMEQFLMMNDRIGNATDLPIVLENVGRRLSPVAGIFDVSLQLKKGEILSLVGQTGAGKTTLLNLVAGLESLDHGRILLNGIDAERIKPHKRGVSMIFQRDVFYPGQRLEKDWAEAEKKGVLQRWSDTGFDPRELLNELQLPDSLLKQKPETLSGGQARRASLLRAMLQDRPILLADEPLTGLDLWTRDSVSRLLWRFIKSTGKSMIVVAHEPSEAFGLADTIAVMHEGRLLQSGTSEDLLNNPQHLEMIRLLQFPPMNDISQFLPDNKTTIAMMPAKCTWIEFQPSSSNKNREVRFLRNRWTPSGEYTEWKCNHSNQVFWVERRPEFHENGWLCWDHSAQILFDIASGKRIHQARL
jgi:ABC-type sugar transport system ATPase subunit